MSNIDSVYDVLKSTGMVAIIRGQFSAERILDLAAVLCEAEIRLIEVTLNTTDALRAIEALRARFDSDAVIVGAGTVRTAIQLEEAVVAGARFTVAPNLDIDCVRRARGHDILHMPGVLTPTEVQQAVNAGCRVLKLFPSEMFGPAYLKALRAPLDDVDFVPTGGITPENMGAYVRAGAVAVGIGSWLISSPDQPLSEVADKARAFRDAWNAAHAPASS